MVNNISTAKEQKAESKRQRSKRAEVNKYSEKANI